MILNNLIINSIKNIQKHLKSIGIDIINITPIRDSFLIKCRSGDQEIFLYCVIAGPKTFIEEEIAKLIELKLRKKIDLSGNRDYNWKKRVKKDVIQTLRDKKVKLEELIKSTGLTKLEASFPNICAVLKKIEISTVCNSSKYLVVMNWKRNLSKIH
ncbi:hypothetical protein LCGC14_0779800 [marine sediment metagenome]|uniref:Uncharacterized protein n=1 Tax=marine sediment metagenome TaxID=412755 RepID=A0A0F9QFR6_9ZZZZ